MENNSQQGHWASRHSGGGSGRAATAPPARRSTSIIRRAFRRAALRGPAGRSATSSTARSILHSENDAGSTGYQPVPSGHRPDGMGRGPDRNGVQKIEAALLFRAAGSRAAQAGCLCYPAAPPPSAQNKNGRFLAEPAVEKVRAADRRSREQLLEVGFPAGFFELLLRRFGFRLGSAFEHGLGRAFD